MLIVMVGDALEDDTVKSMAAAPDASSPTSAASARAPGFVSARIPSTCERARGECGCGCGSQCQVGAQRMWLPKLRRRCLCREQHAGSRSVDAAARWCHPGREQHAAVAQRHAALALHRAAAGHPRRRASREPRCSPAGRPVTRFRTPNSAPSVRSFTSVRAKSGGADTPAALGRCRTEATCVGRSSPRPAGFRRSTLKGLGEWNDFPAAPAHVPARLSLRASGSAVTD
jgi:hypothetical protein